MTEMKDHLVLKHGDLSLTWWSHGDESGVQLKEWDAIDLPDDETLLWLHEATGAILEAKEQAATLRRSDAGKE